MKRCRNCRAKTTPSYGRCTECGYLMEPMDTTNDTQEPGEYSSGTPARKVAWRLHDLPQSLFTVAFLMSLIPVGVAMFLLPDFLSNFSKYVLWDYKWVLLLIHIFSFAFAMVINIVLYRLWCEIILPAIRNKFGD